MSQSSEDLSYRGAGVDIDAGNALVDTIKPLIAATQRPEVIGGLGGFGGLFRLPAGYREPVLVSGTDGIGTKLLLGLQTDRIEGLGIDLVAMCVNDIIVCGAEPLFFLDYYATGKLDGAQAARLIRGIAEGCQQAGCALIGGETAEMPGLYGPGEFDAAGFCVGIVEADELLDGSRVAIGDRVIGVASSGLHSNGYSLVRRVLDATGADLAEDCGGLTLAEQLLTPTRIYAAAVAALKTELPLHAIAHITGGGLAENFARVLPEGLGARIDTGSWQEGPVFDWLRASGRIADAEMRRTFNCGLGLVLVVPEEAADDTIARLRALGEQAWPVGTITAREDRPVILT